MNSGALTSLFFITKSRELPSNGSFQKELLFSDGLPFWTNYPWEMCPYELGDDGGGGGSNKYAGTLSSGISSTVFSLECSCTIEKAPALFRVRWVWKCRTTNCDWPPHWVSHSKGLSERKAYGQYLELTCLKIELKVVSTW